MGNNWCCHPILYEGYSKINSFQQMALPSHCVLRTWSPIWILPKRLLPVLKQFKHSLKCFPMCMKLIVKDLSKQIEQLLPCCPTCNPLKCGCGLFLSRKHISNLSFNCLTDNHLVSCLHTVTCLSFLVLHIVIA